MDEKARGCIMADEMGLGEWPGLCSEYSTADHVRKNTAVHRITMDSAEAIPLTWQTDLREGDCRLSNIASRELGERTRSVRVIITYGLGLTGRS